MPARFVNIDHDTPLLLPVDLRQWVPKDHLVHFIMDAVAELNLRGTRLNERGSGDEQCPPRMTLGLLLHSYATGVFASRQIERSTHENLAVRLLCADTHPDHDTIRTLRRVHREWLARSFAQVIEMSARRGLSALMLAGSPGVAMHERADLVAHLSPPRAHAKIRTASSQSIPPSRLCKVRQATSRFHLPGGAVRAPALSFDMKRRHPHAFTLIEMVTVVTVIIVLAGLVISVAGYVQNKGAREKTLTQIKNLGLQCEAYKVDNGTVPQNADTDALDPRVHLSPISGSSGPLYQRASRYLYSCLSGDYEPPTQPDFQPEKGERVYYNFRRDELNFTKDNSGNITGVNYVQDPFGNSFGYSTAGAAAEAEYRKTLREQPGAARPDAQRGYNPTYDLWSTGGATSGTSKWIKNWGS